MKQVWRAIAPASHEEAGSADRGRQGCQASLSKLEELEMKKTLIALAALNLVGVASAQSSVTLFGTLDAAVSYYRNESTSGVTTSQWALSNSGLGSSRLGFRGTEDLGGGLAASYWLESQLNNDDGRAGSAVQFFNRRSTVSLSGILGEVRLGRDYTPTVWNDVVFDPFYTIGSGGNLLLMANTPFNNNGIAGSGGNNYIRASNSVGYFLPPGLGGFYGQLMYSFPEATKFDPGALTPNTPNTQRAGRYAGGRFGYTSGPLDVAASYSQNTIGDNFFVGTTTSVDNFNLGASYDFGVVKLSAEYTDSKAHVDYKVTPTDPVHDIDLKGYLIGATVPVGPGLIRATYAQVKYDFNRVGVSNPSAYKWALGYVYNLSKRTALYATVGYVHDKDGGAMTVWGLFSTQPKSSTGYDFGIRHNF